ncbi:MAG: XylR family transcriptional regulator [Verrucomicrobiota bacterium]
MASRRRRPPRVAILVETTRTYTRELLAGVRRYVAARGPWSCFIELRALESGPPPWLRNWDGDGILTRTFTRGMADAIAATGLPAVELRATSLRSERPFVGMDNRLIGQMVAEHFFDRGYRNFAVYSLHTERFFEERARNFVAAVRQRGGGCARLPEPVSDRAADWERGQARLISWLTALPKPVGVFAANDQLGVRLLDACQRAGIPVPEEVAVVGAENEETLCAFANPPLTSVRFDGATVGFAAAQLLAHLMRGGARPKGEILFPPKGIVVRQSSDEFVIHDRLVAHAARVIRENATTGMNVGDLCRKLNASRSTLDRRMKAAIGRTPKEEILRVRFREVERLLRETNLTVEAIACQTGFAYSHYLQAAFKESYGQTPGEFRCKE